MSDLKNCLSPTGTVPESDFEANPYGLEEANCVK